MKAVKLLAVGLLGLIAFQSCKKGENDPFLSLKSRNARIVGEWKLEKSTSERIQSYDYGEISHSDSTISIYENGEMITSGNYPDTSVYTYNMGIQKDGTLIEKWLSEDEEEEYATTWSWSHDTKKKTGILLDYTEFKIDRLKDNELVLTSNSSGRSKDDNGDASSFSRKVSMTFVKQ